jgi:lipoprotein-anchoring transpeptidase ErfK/SrfK
MTGFPKVPDMRRFAIFIVVAIALVASLSAASAGVLVHIDKSSQRMMVAIDGLLAHVWPVSTGRGGFGTPTGSFRPQRLARSWFSTRYYGSPMPHSIFFHRGYAIHGTYHISRLGGPASHGCVRLHPGNAATLFALVSRAGMSNTSILITGANPSLRRRLAHF